MNNKRNKTNKRKYCYKTVYKNMILKKDTVIQNKQFPAGTIFIIEYIYNDYHKNCNIYACFDFTITKQIKKPIKDIKKSNKEKKEEIEKLQGYVYNMYDNVWNYIHIKKNITSMLWKVYNKNNKPEVNKYFLSDADAKNIMDQDLYKKCRHTIDNKYCAYNF